VVIHSDRLPSLKKLNKSYWRVSLTVNVLRRRQSSSAQSHWRHPRASTRRWFASSLSYEKGVVQSPDYLSVNQVTLRFLIINHILLQRMSRRSLPGRLDCPLSLVKQGNLFDYITHLMMPMSYASKSVISVFYYDTGSSSPEDT